MKSYIRNYPRPQLVRKTWKNLNGVWKFLFDDDNAGEAGNWYADFPQGWRDILVPFTYETEMSGIGDTKEHKYIWYERSLELDQEELSGRRVLLHFEGSDFLTKVWINGKYAGCHTGGYDRFSFDVTELAHQGENHIVVKVEDSVDTAQPRGKQRWQKESFVCWYVQTTGIWKTVWLETVPEVFLSGLKITPDIDNHSVRLSYTVTGEDLSGDLEIAASVYFKETLIQTSVKRINRRTVEDTIDLYCPEESPSGVHMWDPRNPELYDLRICILRDGISTDEVLSYFGFREIRIQAGNILLNGEPLYQRLILNQGYWAKSHLTPPDEEAMVSDIDMLQKLGYNGLRMHMKTEDERFLYWCDVKGMLVWGEMAAAYEFCDRAVQEFTKEWMEVVRQYYNHPCIITWTPFNESWGIPQVRTSRKQQDFTEAVYHITKCFDDMRPVIMNDGWEHTISDIITLHDYEADGETLLERYEKHLKEIMEGRIFHNGFKCALANGYNYEGKPVIISEYGGIAFAGGEKDSWGYGAPVTTEEEFLKRFDRVTTAIKKIPYVVGYCYTQVSDVQQEINGLLDADHQFKITPEKIKEINERQVGIRRIKG